MCGVGMYSCTICPATHGALKATACTASISLPVFSCHTLVRVVSYCRIGTGLIGLTQASLAYCI